MQERDIHIAPRRQMIAQKIGEIAGLKVKKLEYVPQSVNSDSSPNQPAGRLDKAGHHEEQLKRHRQSDSGLDALAEALDLEVIE